jgi:molybdopterin molybdotransferase
MGVGMNADGCCLTGLALSIEDVEALLRESLSPVEGEALELNAAVGRILTEPVNASNDMPPFDAAAMDGYALRVSDLVGTGPWRLPITFRVAAGDGVGVLPRAQCARVFTGAPVPKGADCVVMQEHVQLDGHDVVFCLRPEIGANIRPGGQDRREGAQVLTAGRRLDARAMLAAAASGAGKISVKRKLRIAVLTTGAELVPTGSVLRPGQIWDANGPMLRAALADPTIALDHAMLALDSVEEQAEHLRTLGTHDLIFTTGGVSVGEEDRLAAAIVWAGGKARVLRLAIKPGQHLVVGSLGRAVILALPGNPVSAFVGFHLFGRYAIDLLLGHKRQERVLTGRLAEPLRRKPGRREYRPVRIRGYGTDGCPIVDLAPTDFSARSAWFGSADALAVLSEECSTMDARDKIELVML